MDSRCFSMERTSQNQNATQERSGFTITELLVAITIISVLIAMIVPAVQHSRETARRLDCQNRLRQLGIALQNFETRHRSFPVEGGPWIRDPYGASSSLVAARYSVLAQLLSDLDQSTVTEDFDFTKYNGPPSPSELKLEIFLCPSDPSGSKGTNYRVCTGSNPELTLEMETWGVFMRGQATKTSSVTDGLTQTVVISERLRSDESFDPYQPLKDSAGSGYATLVGQRSVSADEMLDVCGSLNGSFVGYSGRVGHYWADSSDLLTRYNHVAPPNSRVPDCAITDYSVTRGDPPGHAISTFRVGQMTARSQHSGVVNCLLGDGSARPVSDSIDLRIWRGLSTYSGEEVISEF